ncbi:response regulator [Sulfurimonas sp.]|uniref:response regulator n=1 Tax=Sulfurimonas sp. TaxID=2022749 RepID=UPI002B499040|nr:response regulator [Sulfurimonas sp.]
MMFEIYFNEIIATIAILIITIIYIIIKKLQKKNNFQLEELIENKDSINDRFDIKKEKVTKIVKEIVLDSDEKKSFENIQEKETLHEEKIEQTIKRVKRPVPNIGKITKENFKLFAGQRILVAEDNIINQKVITGLFTGSGIDITLADDGQFALDILEKDLNYDFILMDVHMPRISGFEASKRIRKNSKYNHIVIISLSGDVATDDVRKMTEAGMEEHLEKPLRMEALYKILYAYSKDTSKQNNTKELEIQSGLNICGDDEEFYFEILNEFVNTYTKSPNAIKTFLNNKKMIEADKYLLDLSGISANIGANNISKIVLDLKMAITTPKDRRYVELFKNYVHSLHILLKEIKTYKS